MYSWKIYRDVDTLRLRKVVIELLRDGVCVHKTRMFLRSDRAIDRRKRWMMKVSKRLHTLSLG